MSFDVTGDDKHVVAMRPLLNPTTAFSNHHAILHVCTSNAFWDDHVTPKPCSQSVGSEGQSPLGELNSGCSSLMWVWAVGGGDWVLPSNVGFRIGNSLQAVSHVILEVHYDNPALREGLVDDFGFEMYYVNALREHDAGGMTLGDPTLRMQISNGGLFGWPYESGNLQPGKQDLIHRQATCPSECTSSFARNVTVFGSNLHMHTAGQKMYTQLYDSEGNAKPLLDQMRIDFWDNGFQGVEAIPDGEFVIQPGDMLQTHCYFNTSARTKEVTFGTGTLNEMCMNFIFYYPAQYRGVDADGSPLKLANCGIFAATSALPPVTLCGGLSQTGLGAGAIDSVGFLSQLSSITSSLPDFMVFGGQQGKGRTLEPDPLHFGAINVSSSRPSASRDKCFPAGETIPSPLPPPPPAPPGANLIHSVVLTLRASGNVESYDNSSRAALRTAVASVALVSAGKVTIEIAPASVVITATIATSDSAASSSIADLLTTAMPDATTASALLGISVEINPAVSAVVSVSIAPPPPYKPGEEDLPIVIALASLTGLINIIAFGMLAWTYVLRSRAPPSEGSGKTPKALAARPEQTAASPPMSPPGSVSGSDEEESVVMPRALDVSAAAADTERAEFISALGPPEHINRERPPSGRMAVDRITVRLAWQEHDSVR
mmetsp:Transcript_12195/g.32484  ORF Transcript_12195/g.32484 Transcript_12195/m.32484 type:complete len:659 (+) Transcript_12195:793-2769(+)